ncbi:MAG TPA: DUF1707 and DUF4190 domain-containing protein [Streptosporangiaceae bacterium]
MTFGRDYGAPGGGRAQMRAATADRDRAVEFLTSAFTEGRLDKDEYDLRLERALSARTYAELDTVVADLPGTRPTPAAPVAVPRTNSLAVASFVCGIAEFFTLGLTAIPAVVLGHMARNQIRRSGEEGAGLALAGLLLGWAAVALGVLLILAVVVGFAVAAGHTAVPAQPQP